MNKKILFSIIFILLLTKFIAFSIQWPIKDFNIKHQLLTNFGQFQYYKESEINYKYTHTGIDIIASNYGTENDIVYSVCNGKIICIGEPSNLPKYHYIIILDQDNQCAWWYTHIDIDQDLQMNQNIHVGERIGVITDFATKWNHIHFMKISDNVKIELYNPPPPSQIGPIWQPIDYESFNPLPDLSPNNDIINPEIKSIVFRSAVQEGVYGALYLNEKKNNIPIIYGNVDIIVEAFDEFIDDDYESGKLSVNEISYDICDINNPSVSLISETKLVDFNTYSILKDYYIYEKYESIDHYTEIIYEYDNICESKSQSPFYYILTNVYPFDNPSVTPINSVLPRGSMPVISPKAL